MTKSSPGLSSAATPHHPQCKSLVEFGDFVDRMEHYAGAACYDGTEERDPDKCQKCYLLQIWRELVERITEAEQWEQQYNRIMSLLRNIRMPHGLCQPRERKACTNCNSQEELGKLVDEYKGARIIRF